jgi:hypothetical protein
VTSLSPAFTYWPGLSARDAQAAREGRADRLLRDHRGLLLDLRALGLQVVGVGVDLRLAHGLYRELRLVALEHGGGLRGGGFGGVQQGDVGVGVELDQQRAGLHVLARLEVHGAHQARHFGAEVGAAHRVQRADGGELRLPLHLLHLDRRHGLRARLGHGRDQRADLQELAERERGDQQQHAADHDDHSPGHR